MSTRQSLRRRMTGHATLFGLLQTVPAVIFTEIAANCGFDFVILDTEHGLYGDMELLHAISALNGGATAACVRVRNHDPQTIGRMLDLGADGIVVPNVTTADEARRLVRAFAHPPLGARGDAGPLARASRYGTGPARASASADQGAVEPAADRALLTVMIESGAGAGNAQGILAVEGVDAVVIGPLDLAADLDCQGDFSAAAYRDAIEQIERAASVQGKVVGTAPHGPYTVRALIDRGHRLVTLGADVTFVREALTTAMAGAKGGT